MLVSTSLTCTETGRLASLCYILSNFGAAAVPAKGKLSLTLGNIAAVPKDLLGSGSPQIAMHIRAAQYYCRLPKNGARI